MFHISAPDFNTDLRDNVFNLFVNVFLFSFDTDPIFTILVFDAGDGWVVQIKNNKEDQKVHYTVNMNKIYLVSNTNKLNETNWPNHQRFDTYQEAFKIATNLIVSEFYNTITNYNLPSYNALKVNEISSKIDDMIKTMISSLDILFNKPLPEHSIITLIYDLISINKNIVIELRDTSSNFISFINNSTNLNEIKELFKNNTVYYVNFNHGYLTCVKLKFDLKDKLYSKVKLNESRN